MMSFLLSTVGFVAWLATAPFLEWMRARSGWSTPEAAAQAQSGALQRPAPRHAVIGAIWTVLRLMLSLGLGFCAGAFLDACYEDFLAPRGTDIEFGDPASFLFLMAGTAIIWLLLWQLGRFAALSWRQ
jgi:hypothetical protein